jgi:hypothetical protein
MGICCKVHSKIEIRGYLETYMEKLINNIQGDDNGPLDDFS